jgi:hypothetical protein
MKIVIFIMNFNWLEWTKHQAEFYSDCGHFVVIVDNKSTYQPLLEWYKTCPYTVLYTGNHTLTCQNRFVWEMGLEKWPPGNYYAVTDSDLGVDKIPTDFADVLIQDIERSPRIIKSGFSLFNNDLPDNPYANIYRESEKDNYRNQDVHGFCNVPIDTTFAIYSKERCRNIDKMWRKEGEPAPTSFLDDRYFYRAHRAPYPYTAKHLPWYMDINNLTPEQVHHISVAKYGSLNNFKKIYAKELKELYGL